MIYIFPRMTKCTFHKFGVSGEVEKHDALCILPLNIVNEKIYIFIWFWYIFAFASDLFKNRYQHSKQARSVSLWMRRLGTSTASRLGLGLCGCGDTDLAYLLCQYLFLNKPIPDSVFIFVISNDILQKKKNVSFSAFELRSSEQKASTLTTRPPPRPNCRQLLFSQVGSQIIEIVRSEYLLVLIN